MGKTPRSPRKSPRGSKLSLPDLNSVKSLADVPNDLRNQLTTAKAVVSAEAATAFFVGNDEGFDGMFTLVGQVLHNDPKVLRGAGDALQLMFDMLSQRHPAHLLFWRALLKVEKRLFSEMRLGKWLLQREMVPERVCAWRILKVVSEYHDWEPLQIAGKCHAENFTAAYEAAPKELQLLPDSYALSALWGSGGGSAGGGKIGKLQRRLTLDSYEFEFHKLSHSQKESFRLLIGTKVRAVAESVVKDCHLPWLRKELETALAASPSPCSKNATKDTGAGSASDAIGGEEEVVEEEEEEEDDEDLEEVVGSQKQMRITSNTTLTSDFLFHATKANEAAIVIAADNVTLDLGGYTVKLANTTKPAGVVGVHIEAGMSHVKVLSGTIEGFTGYGVKCAGAKYCRDNTDIQLERLTITSTVQIPTPTIKTPPPCAGVFFSLCDNVVMRHCHIKDVHALNAQEGAGVYAQLSTALQFENCKVSDVTNQGTALGMFFLFACAGVSFTQCHAENGHTRSLGWQDKTKQSHTCGGFFPIACLDMKFTDCHATLLSSEADDCHGFPIFLCAGVLLERCTATDIFDGCDVHKHPGPSGGGAKATGFEIMSHDVQLKSCTAEGIFALNPADLQCAGFSFGHSHSVSLENCVSRNNKCEGSVGAHKCYSMGFGWAPDPRASMIGPAHETILSECTAEGNNMGFNLFNQDNSQLLSCTSTNNDYGIYNGGDTYPSCTYHTECCPPIPDAPGVTIPAVKNEETKTKIEGCTLSNNSIADYHDPQWKERENTYKGNAPPFVPPSSD